MFEKINKFIQHLRNIFLNNIKVGEKSYVFGRCAIAKNSKITIANNTRIHSIEVIGSGTVVIGSNVEIRDVFINLSNNSELRIEDDIFIGKNSKFIIYGNCKIGKGTLIAPDVLIVDNDHKIEKNRKLKNSGVVVENIQIEDNVWIGAKSIVSKGVTVNSNCVIAASSFVNKDCDSNFLYAGTPARKIKEIYE